MQGMALVKTVCKLLLFWSVVFAGRAQGQTSASDNTRSLPQSTNFGSGKGNSISAGFFSLTSNFTHRGVTQTHGDPASQASLWLHLGPSLNIGVWGSNTFFAGEVQHFVTKPFLDVNLLLTPNLLLFVKYSNVKYYRDNSRDGNTVELHLSMNNFTFGIERDSNWYGSQEKSEHFTLAYFWNFAQNFGWYNEFGYDHPYSSSYMQYYHLVSTLEYRLTPVTLQLTQVYLTKPAQFISQAQTLSVISIVNYF
jgi:uncharacterized protein (TIGR02001 family)